MPEFEEENVNASPSESYTPSTDASKKPRTRRRSGGFRTEVANVSNANIGEVSANEALKEEKLSGTPSTSQAHETRETGESLGDREDRPRRERKPRESRTPREPRTDANPQPSPETLAAIASVEAKIAERRAERDARRAERDKTRTAQTERSERKPRKQGGGKPAPKKGLLASILSIFGLGPKAAPTKKRGGNRGGRPRGKGGNRGGQNRRRGGQNRRRGGQGGHRNNRRSKEKSES
jgi:hypothetical protein